MNKLTDIAPIDYVHDRSWLQQMLAGYWKEKRRGIFQLGTGVGKSRIACMIAESVCKKNPTARIVIGVPLIRLKKDVWTEQFNEWGYGDILKNVQLECYQTLRTWKDEDVDLFIGDEIDTSLTPEYSKFYKNNNLKNVLGLTATLSEEKWPFLHEFDLPVLFEYSTKKASEDKFLNKATYHLIEYGLSNKFKVPIDLKKYNAWDREWIRIYLKGCGIKDVWNNEKFEIGEYDYYGLTDRILKKRELNLLKLGFSLGDVYTELQQKHDKQTMITLYACHKYLNQRKNIILTNNTSVHITKLLIKDILSGWADIRNPKILVFAEYIKQVEKICDMTVHSQKTGTPKEKKETNNKIIEAFNEAKTGVLGSCKSMTVGLNLKGANTAIYSNYYSSWRNMQQRAGRLHRLSENDLAHNFLLYPNRTQGKIWADSIVKKIGIDNFNIHRYFDGDEHII